MGIYIKDMEMPTSCVRCRCIRGCHAVNDRIERMDEQPWIPSDHRHNDCPLVPVPTHGRLIDADALMKSDQMVGKLMMYGGEYVYTQSEIDRAPTIIPAEEGE